MTDIICNNCQNCFEVGKIQESLHRFKNNAIHIRGDCPYCKAFVKYVPYKDSHIVKDILFIVWRKENMAELLNYVTIYDDKTEEIY